MKELEGLIEARAGLNKAKGSYDKYRSQFSLDHQTIRYILIDKPIPGVPLPPDESMPLARAMVMQEGEWFLPDRTMAEFTGEPASDVNRRAQERNALPLEKGGRSQVVDFACHIKNRDTRGKPNQLYSRETALALLGLTTNFTRAWTKETAVEAVTRAFDWVEANSDTNPARAIRKTLLRHATGQSTTASVFRRRKTFRIAGGNEPMDKWLPRFERRYFAGWDWQRRLVVRRNRRA